jgi:hypothetical protein
MLSGSPKKRVIPRSEAKRNLLFPPHNNRSLASLGMTTDEVLQQAYPGKSISMASMSGTSHFNNAWCTG